MIFFQTLMKKIKKINFLVLMIELVLVFVLVFSVWQIVLYFNEGKQEEAFNEELIQSAITKVESEDEFESDEEDLLQITPFEGFDATLSDLLIYPDIQVDFETIKKKYPKVVGWIYSPGTPINYPVVQGSDNAYFVNRMPNGIENAAGSIFMDYRDSATLSDFASVLYGHNMKNNSMFGTLLDYKKAGFFEEHPFMFYFTEERTYRLEIFAGVNTIATSNLYLEPDDPAAFITSAFSSSTFSSKVVVTPQDKIMLMSTCSGAVGQANRYVIFAKLVEI